MKPRYWTALFVAIALTLAGVRYGPRIVAAATDAYTPTLRRQRMICSLHANCATVSYPDGTVCSKFPARTDEWTCSDE